MRGAAEPEQVVLTPCVDHGRKGYGMGYATAWVVYDGAKRPTTLHRKTYYLATGDWPPIVRHTCDNPRCINPEHLVGGTQQDNMQDCKDRGRWAQVSGNAGKRGEASASAKLTAEDVAFIRQHYRKHSREFGLPAMARRFEVGTSQVFRIVRGETW